eukprot:SAG25_NODE_125_length_14598_cov_7.819611_4_plen_141_part_00
MHDACEQQGGHNLIPGSARVLAVQGMYIYVCMCTKIRDGCSEFWAEAENHEIPSVTPCESARAAAENTLNFLSALRALNSFSESARAAACIRIPYEVCMCPCRPRNQVVPTQQARRDAPPAQLSRRHSRGCAAAASRIRI